MSITRRIIEAIKVFVIFGICGFISLHLVLEQIVRNWSGSPLLHFLTFGASGSIAWLIFCRRRSELWLIAGVTAAIIHLPLRIILIHIFLVAVLGFPMTPTQALESLTLRFSQIEYVDIPFCLLAGGAGAFLCRLFLKQSTLPSAGKETGS